MSNRRTPIACYECAKSKTKCDKQLPCSRCSKRGLKCTLRLTRRGSKEKSRVGGNGPTASSSPPDQPLPRNKQQQQQQQPTDSQTYQGSPYTDPGDEKPTVNGFSASSGFASPQSGALLASIEGEAVSHDQTSIKIEDHMSNYGYEYFSSTTAYGPMQRTYTQAMDDWQRMPIVTGFGLVPWPDMDFEMSFWPDAPMQYVTPNSALLEDDIITMIPELFEALNPPKELLQRRTCNCAMVPE